MLSFFKSEFGTIFFFIIFFFSFSQGHNVCKDNKNDTCAHPEAVTCNSVAMEVQHLCKLLTGPDKGLGSRLIGRCVSCLLALR